MVSQASRPDASYKSDRENLDGNPVECLNFALRTHRTLDCGGSPDSSPVKRRCGRLRQPRRTEVMSNGIVRHAPIISQLSWPNA